MGAFENNSDRVANRGWSWKVKRGETEKEMEGMYEGFSEKTWIAFDE